MIIIMIILLINNSNKKNNNCYEHEGRYEYITEMMLRLLARLGELPRLAPAHTHIII